VSRLRGQARSAARRLPRRVRRGAFRLIGRPFPESAGADRPIVSDPDDAPGGNAGFNRAYVRARPDLLERLPTSCRNILDLGCATGEVGDAVKRRIPGARVTGVELDPAMAALASDRLDRVIRADLEDPEAIARDLAGESFDGMIAGDILEHLVDPWRTLRSLRSTLAPDATVVASLPNVGFWDTWWNVVVRRRWPYRPRGIHDSTHLRFFARRNVEPLFTQAGFRVERIDRTYRLFEHPHRYNRFARRVAIPGLRDLLTFQFLIIARPAGGGPVEFDRPPGDHDELMPSA
jgi:SAM-dependent methyltransferase